MDDRRCGALSEMARPYFKYFPLNHAIPPRFLSDNADAA